MRLLTAFVAGVFFALGLGVSGMTLPSKVFGFLDITGSWDPSLAFVMVGAIGVHLVATRLIRRRQAPVFERVFAVPTRADITRPLVVGQVMFGAGWALSGYCPGPGVVALVSGVMPALVFTGSMAVGMLLYRLVPSGAEADVLADA